MLVHDGSKSFLHSPNTHDFNYVYSKNVHTNIYTHGKVKLSLGLPQPHCFLLSSADTLWAVLWTPKGDTSRKCI